MTYNEVGMYAIPVHNIDRFDITKTESFRLSYDILVAGVFGLDGDTSVNGEKLEG